MELSMGNYLKMADKQKLLALLELGCGYSGRLGLTGKR
jgi:hypothetical protein